MVDKGRRRFFSVFGLFFLTSIVEANVLTSRTGGKAETFFGELLEFFPAHSDAYFLGREYVNKVADKSSLDRQLSELRTRLSLNRNLCSRKERIRFYRSLFVQDFEEERTISLEGWVISETEALIYAAIYLKMAG